MSISLTWLTLLCFALAGECVGVRLLKSSVLYPSMWIWRYYTFTERYLRDIPKSGEIRTKKNVRQKLVELDCLLYGGILSIFFHRRFIL